MELRTTKLLLTKITKIWDILRLMNPEAAVICSEGKPKYWVILPYIDFFGSAPEGIINLDNFRSPKPEMWRMGEFVLRYFRKV
jgi:hypothetical protein